MRFSHLPASPPAWPARSRVSRQPWIWLPAPAQPEQCRPRFSFLQGLTWLKTLPWWKKQTWPL
ncbi:hypothetical protein BLAT2472_40281 [Burkholderia latens]